jgi:hypothetical protein
VLDPHSTLLRKPLLTATQRTQLLADGRKNSARNAAAQAERDFVPVVKLFTPDVGATWRLTELDPEDLTQPSDCAIAVSAVPNLVMFR